MTTQVNVPQAQKIDCAEFVGPNNTHGTTRAVVIAPLRITVVSEFPETYKISFGCNFWKSCKNEDCSFSMLASER